MVKTTSNLITCPKCGAEFQLADTVLYPFQQEWKKQWEAGLKPKLDAEKEKATKEANRAIEELQSELNQSEKKLKESQDVERSLRNRLKKVDAREKELDLEVDRKVDEEKKKLSDEYNKKIVEKDYENKELLTKIKELQEKSEQISPQIKGDALQYELERMLESSFPEDDIEIVKRGAKGADIIQKVKDKNNNMQLCGTILWESKNTASWNTSWIPKLKNDQRDKKADIAAIASIVTPENVTTFGMVENVWVARLPVACCLSDVLRFSLIEITNNRLSLEGRDQKIEALYAYFAGPEFKQRIEPVVEALLAMQEDIDQERRAMEGIWNTRKKEIEKAIKGATGFYSDIRGIIGRALLPQIKGLQLLASGNDSESN